MTITETKIKGCYIIENKCFKDDRGYFMRAFCHDTLTQYGINADFVQSNISYNEKKWTLRGLHSQTSPDSEDKLVLCARGRILDVCVDVNPDSLTYKSYVSAELSEDNKKSLYIPKGCAHGYLTLEDDSQIIYYTTHNYVPESEKGYRFDDPQFGIDWGISDFSRLIISEKDRNHKLLGNDK